MKFRLNENKNQEQSVCTREIAKIVESMLPSASVDYDETTGSIYIEDEERSRSFQVAVQSVYMYTLIESTVGPVQRNGKPGERKQFINMAASDIITSQYE